MKQVPPQKYAVFTLTAGYQVQLKKPGRINVLRKKAILIPLLNATYPFQTIRDIMTED